MGISLSTLSHIQNTKRRLADIVAHPGVRARFMQSAAHQDYSHPYAEYLKAMKTPSFSWKPDSMDENIWHATQDPLSKNLAFIDLQIHILQKKPEDRDAAAMLITQLHNLALNLDLVAYNGQKIFNIRDTARLSQVWPQKESVHPEKVQSAEKLFALLKNQFAPNVRELTRQVTKEADMTYDQAASYLKAHGDGVFLDHLQGRDTFVALQRSPDIAA